ncbi:hypothetical protein PC115_g25662, partial [Phytophthora cactorum]
RSLQQAGVPVSSKDSMTRGCAVLARSGVVSGLGCGQLQARKWAMRADMLVLARGPGRWVGHDHQKRELRSAIVRAAGERGDAGVSCV